MAPREDAHARMVVQRYLVAFRQAEDTQGEGRLFMDVHICHRCWPSTACVSTFVRSMLHR